MPTAVPGPDEVRLPGAVVPDLAVAHEVSEDGLVHTLRMRPDVFWHDGLRVTAQDAIYTFEVLGHPDFPGTPPSPTPPVWPPSGLPIHLRSSSAWSSRSPPS